MELPWVCVPATERVFQSNNRRGIKLRIEARKRLGSGCGAVGKAVASNTRGPGFESSHRQLLLNIYLLLTVYRKDENEEKEAGNGPFFKRSKP